MSLFTIDREKCKRDGVCAQECPLGIIAMHGENGFPSSVKGAESLCINCGHCMAVCPKGALSLKTMSPVDCTPVPGDGFVSPEQAAGFLRSRRSIRTYLEKAVERGLIQGLIDIASYAPSGHNAQPVSWLVIEDRSEVLRLSGYVVDWMRYMIKEKPEMAAPLHLDLVVGSWERGEDRICRGAPHVILAYAPESLPTAPSACTIALTYLELAAYSMGLGACWAGYFNVAAMFYPPMKQALNLPQGYQCYGAMMIGYPKYRYRRIPLRNKPSITWR